MMPAPHHPADLQNLGEFIFLHPGGNHPGAFNTGEAGQGWSFAALQTASRAFGRGLLASGQAQPGDRLALLSGNSAEYLIAFSGAMQAGLTVVPLNYRLPATVLAEILDDAQCRAICVDDLARVPAGRMEALIPFRGTGTGSFSDLCAQGPALDTEAAPPLTETACILYTSGTTGQPKGVMLTHAGQTWALARTLPPFAAMAGSTTLMAAPYYHMNGLFISMNCLAGGVTLAIMPQFDARTYLGLLDKLQCRFLTGIPAMFVMMARETDLIPPGGFACVEHLILGSSPLSRKQLDTIRKLFPRANVRNAFGTTEGGAYVFGPHPLQLPIPEGSIGYPAEGVEVALRQGPDSMTGTLHMRSPAVMSGYLNQPELTATKLRDGWYNTGDIMRRDAQGFFYHMGRADDMFVCGGENIYSGDVEALLERHDAVAQAAVVPMAHDIKNFVPIAFVVRSPGADVSEDDLRAFARAHGPAHAHPRRILFLDALPVAASFKYDRTALIERARALYDH